MIWDLRGAFHVKPTSSMHCYRSRLVERSLTLLFCATIPESRPETFQPASGFFLEFTKQYFQRHKTALLVQHQPAEYEAGRQVQSHWPWQRPYPPKANDVRVSSRIPSESLILN